MSGYVDPNSGRAPQPGGAGVPQSVAKPAPAPETDEVEEGQEQGGADEPQEEATSMEASTEPPATDTAPAEPASTEGADAEGTGDADQGGDETPDAEGDGSGDEGSDEDAALEDMSHAELMEVANELEIAGRHQMNSASLVEAINEARETE